MNILCFPLYYSEAIQKIKYKKKTSKETEKEEKIVAYIETINKREQKTFQPILDTKFLKFVSNHQLKRPAYGRHSISHYSLLLHLL